MYGGQWTFRAPELGIRPEGSALSPCSHIPLGVFSWADQESFSKSGFLITSHKPHCRILPVRCPELGWRAASLLSVLGVCVAQAGSEGQQAEASECFPGRLTAWGSVPEHSRGPGCQAPPLLPLAVHGFTRPTGRVCPEKAFSGHLPIPSGPVLRLYSLPEHCIGFCKGTN